MMFYWYTYMGRFFIRKCISANVTIRSSGPDRLTDIFYGIVMWKDTCALLIPNARCHLKEEQTMEGPTRTQTNTRS